MSYDRIDDAMATLHMAECEYYKLHLSQCRDNYIELRGQFNSLLSALQELVARCDGAEGVRADGSNIQTYNAHAAIAKAEEFA